MVHQILIICMYVYTLADEYIKLTGRAKTRTTSDKHEIELCFGVYLATIIDIKMI